MNKIKLIITVIAVVIGLCLITSCAKVENVNNNQEGKDGEKSVVTILSEQFKEEIKNEKNIEKVANKIAQNEILQISTDVAVLKKSDYISGFQTEIKGFDKVVAIRPMISTIPFLAYIFEVKEADAFAENLKKNADLRWNICTEADDLEVSVVDKYVFFVMSPKNFDAE